MFEILGEKFEEKKIKERKEIQKTLQKLMRYFNEYEIESDFLQEIVTSTFLSEPLFESSFKDASPMSPSTANVTASFSQVMVIESPIELKSLKTRCKSEDAILISASYCIAENKQKGNQDYES